MSFLDFSTDASDPNNPNAALVTPDQIARRQQMAAELMKQGSDYSPVRSPWQGVARMANAALGGFMNYKLGTEAQEANKSNSDALTAAMLGLKGGSSPAMAPATPPASAPASMPTQMGAALASDGKPAPVPPANIGNGGAGVTAPASLLPHFQAASAATGIPIPVLVAQAKQESNLNPNAVGRAGEIGLTQIMPSTARSPGFGVQGVDPSALKDPATNIMFGAQYLAGRGKAAGVQDWNDPAQVAKALSAYNGGGDPNYAQHVMRYVPQGALGAIAQAAPQQIASNAPGLGYAPGQVQSAPLPAPDPASAGGLTPQALQGFAQRQGMAPPPAPDPTGGATLTGAANPDAPAPGAVNAGPAPVQPDPVLAATAARAAHPQPGDQMIPLDQLRPGSAAYPNMEGSPEAAAATSRAQQAQQAVQMQQLMGVIQNPYSTPAQRQIATMVMQKYIGQDQVKTITDKDGSIWQQKPDGSLTLVQDKGKIEVIGKDAMGNPTYGTRAQVEGRTPAAAPATTQPAVDPNLRGQDYLKQMPPDVQSHIQAVIEGREDYPSPQQLKMPYWKNIADGVQAVDPTFQIGNAGARKKLMVDATSGKMADTTNALNTAIGHLGELSDQAEALGNRSGLSIATQPYNYLTNKAQQLSGNPAQTNFESTRGKVAEELVKAYRGAGGAESDIQRELGAITESQSPEQLRGAIKNAATLLQSKIEANQKQWDDGMGPMTAKRDFLSPKARAVIDGINQRADGKAVKSVIPAEGAGQPAGAVAKPQSKADFDALPSGSHFLDPHGVERIKP